MISRRIVFPATLLCAALLGGCSSTYYNAMEKVGFPKRDILVSRVGEARESQHEAKEQFASALEKFLAVTKIGGGELETKYGQLNTEFKRSESRAAEVNERITSVADVSEALFTEWKKELSQYSDTTLRNQSQRQLDQTRERYNDLMRTMRAAASRMEPILAKFRDQVLFLKHNLNAQAIAGLTATATNLQGDVTGLIADMEKSIREADEFIRSMKTP